MKTLRLTAAAIACAAVFPAQAALIADANLQAIRFIEFTGPSSTFTFSRLSSQMITRLSNPLDSSNLDFFGLANEFYDVFYSDANGTFNVLGDFVTVEARFSNTSGGGGLNIGAIFLDYSIGPSVQANVLTSFQGLGSNYIPGSEQNAVDASTSTATIMGNTGSSTTDRLRITVGFRANTVPEPGSLALLGLGLAGLGLARRRGTSKS